MNIKINKKPTRTTSLTKKKIGISTLALLLAVMLCATAIIIVKYETRNVNVVCFSKDVMSGTTALTRSDLSSYSIPVSEYDAGVKTYKNSEGKSVTGQTYILWSDVNSVVGKYVTGLQTENTLAYLPNLTSSSSVSNPWLTSLSDGQEVYTMSYDSSGLDTRLLIPGSHIRMRIVASVPASQYETLKKSVSEREKNILSSTSSKTETDPIIDEGILTSADVSSDSSSTTESKYISEIVYPDLVVADIQNSKNESLFDIYSQLVNTSAEKRETFLSSAITSSSTDFVTSLQGTKLVFALTPTEASYLTTLENHSGSIKYTIIVDSTKDSLYSKFQDVCTEINNQIASIVTSK
jgi:hypothetical protein